MIFSQTSHRIKTKFIPSLLSTQTLIFVLLSYTAILLSAETSPYQKNISTPSYTTTITTPVAGPDIIQSTITLKPISISTSAVASPRKISRKPPPKTEDPPIDIKAESIEYDTLNHIVIARGKADIKQLDQRITADEIEIHLDDEIIYVSGGARIERSGDVIYFSSGTFYKQPAYPDGKVKTSTPTFTTAGEIIEVKGFAQSWIFSAKKVNISNKRYIARHNGRFTTCQAPKPHYTITTNRLTIQPGKFVSATNAVFWIGNVPVFYLPYWWKGIGPGKLNVHVEPGYNSIDGFYAKTTAIYDFSDYVRTKFLYDYYSIRGSGYGIESTQSIPDRMKSTVYLYTIKEYDVEYKTTTNRWTAQSYLWGQLPRDWSAQSEINFSSDESFNESYNSSSWNPVQSEINSNLYFTKRTTYSYTSVGASRRQRFDSTTREYLDKQRVFPAITYRRYKGRDYLGFYPEYSIGYTRWSYDADSPFLSDFSGSVIATAQRKLTRDITVSPYLGLDESYSESLKGDFNFYGKYYYGASARWRYIPISFLNADYTYKRKFIIDSLTPDPEGVEKNQISAYVYFFPYTGLTLKTLSGYDFRYNEIATLSNEISYAYKGKGVFLNHRYNLNKSQYEGLLFVFSYDEWISLSVNHNNATPDILGLGASSNFKIGKANTFSIQYNANLENGELKPIARQIKYERDIHCWIASVFYRRRDPEKRPYIEEIFFNIGLKFDDIADKRKKELEKEFYPWRD